MGKLRNTQRNILWKYRHQKVIPDMYKFAEEAHVSVLDVSKFMQGLVRYNKCEQYVRETCTKVYGYHIPDDLLDLFKEWDEYL